MKRILKKLACMLMICTAGTAFARSDQSGPITIDHPWSRATVAAVPTGAVYFVVHNSGQTADRLISVSSPVAERAELHTHEHEGDMVKMRKIEAIDLAPASTVKLEPGGLHVMLMKLKAPLVKGEHFALDLKFERAGSITVQVAVQDITSTTRKGHEHAGHHRHGGHGAHGGHSHQHDHKH